MRITNGRKAPVSGGSLMADEGGKTAQLQRCLELMRGGDDSARAELIHHACERLRALTHKMLKAYPHLRRWEQTDDVLQNALLRLYRCLADVKPDSVRLLFSLAATQIRR